MNFAVCVVFLSALLMYSFRAHNSHFRVELKLYRLLWIHFCIESFIKVSLRKLDAVKGGN